MAKSLPYYRRYVYEHGAQPATKGVLLAPKLVETEAQKGFALTPVDMQGNSDSRKSYNV
jgi:hypothetical protein